ncbi:WD40 repeat-like protein [Clavulina sp. PMI_390]|nr:WD40 repeat-like protein [Clavulina sp. PMI_390]
MIYSDKNIVVKSQTLSTLPHAVDAAITLHDGNGHGCLPGTRTAILNALQTWAAGAPASVLWLQGVAGSGKSSIAVSVAKFFEHTNMHMAYYRFETAKQQQLKPSNLFTTLALQLAAQDAAIEAKLVELVTSATPLQCRSQDPAEQLRLFLLPLLQQNPKAYHQVVIIIDGLDESGKVSERSKILKPLASLASLLPPAVHILITTRPELDITEVIGVKPSVPHVAQLFMHDLPSNLTKDDIHVYVKHMLEGPPLNAKLEQLAMVSDKAQLSFQWVSTACHYIIDQEDGNQAVRPSRRLRNVLSSTNTGDNQVILYRLYSTVMDAQFGHSKGEDLELLRLLLGVLVAAREPLSLNAMLHLLHVRLSLHGDVEDVKEDAAAYVGLMSSLITGTKPADSGIPILALHVSFIEFLQNPGSQYYVDIAQTHMILAESCLAVMQHGEKRLKFNICNLSTSFLPNSAVQGLSALIQENIGEALSYACCFWSSHIVDVPDLPMSTLESIKMLLTTTQFFHWLEVMSLLGESPLDSLCLIPDKLGLGVAAHVAEAVRFASSYSTPIAQSAPHIYLSAIPFIPSSSPLHSLHKQFKGTVSVSSGHLEQWPALRHKLQYFSYVECLAISNQNILAVGLDFGPISLYNCLTGDQYGQQISDQRSVCSLAFSPDGSVLASGEDFGKIRLWDLNSRLGKGEPLVGHSDYINSVAFSPSGSILASGSHDRTIRLWDPETQTAIGQPIIGHWGRVYSVAFSPDGLTLASGSGDSTIRFWDIETQKQKGDPLHGHTHHVFCVTFSPDGTMIASCSADGTIRLWNVNSQAAKGKPLTGHQAEVRSVVFSPDGMQLASASIDKTIRLWDVMTQTALGMPLVGHDGQVTAIVFSNDGTMLASGSDDRTVRLWDAHTKAAREDLVTNYHNYVRSLAFSPNGTVLASGFDDQIIQLWDMGTQAAKGDPLTGHNFWVNSLAFSPDGTILASGSSDGVRLWDMETQTAIGDPLQGRKEHVFSVAFSPNGAILASGSTDRTIKLWDVQTQSIIHKSLMAHDHTVMSVAFSPKGAVFASASWDKTIKLWDVDTQLPLGEPLTGHSKGVTTVAFSPNGLLLASGSDDLSVRFWDVETQMSKGEPLQGHGRGVYSVVFSPDGTMLASGAGDRTVILWDVDTHTPRAEPLIMHNDGVLALAFSPDGSVLATGCDRVVYIWSTNSASLNYVIPFNNGWIQGPNGELILWVPTSYQAHLFDERLVCSLGEDLSSRVTLSFDQMTLGDSWAECFQV